MSTAPRANPYVGPRAFGEAEGGRFFGRERELEELFHLLIARRLVLLHSPSGAGKSSLIQAKLVPRLREQGFRVYPIVRVGTEVPEGVGGNRFRVATLLSLDEAQPEKQRLSAAELSSLSLADYLARHNATDGEEVLIFDQFEEVLSLEPASRQAKEDFFAELGVLLEDGRRWALFTIREDYLGALKPFLLPIPTRLSATYRLDLLNAAQARQAMQGPARTSGGDFEDAAAEQLADDLRRTTVQRPDGTNESVLGQDIEPVQLQVVCYRLWQRVSGVRNQEARSRNQEVTAAEHESHSAPHAISITTADIQATGDVDTALRAYYAEQVAATAIASRVSERAIRDWVEEQLIAEGGLRGQVLRRLDATNGLPNEVIHQLVNAHLLRAEERRGATWYELAHDRLITPIRQDNEIWFEANLNILQRRARLWERANRVDSFLLRGAELVRAEQALHDSALSDIEKIFLKKSQDVQQAEERERKQNRRIRLLAWLTSLASVLALVSLFQTQMALIDTEASNFEAIKQANNAKTAESEAIKQAHISKTAQAEAVSQAQTAESASKQVRVADIMRLAWTARSAINSRTDPELALLLAIETVRISKEEAVANIDNQLAELLRDAILNSYIRFRLSHSGTPLNSAQYSSNGDHVVTASDSDTVTVWNAFSGKPVSPLLQEHQGIVLGAIFSPDNQKIATFGEDGIIRIWDAKSGNIEKSLIGHNATIISAKFSPDSKMIVTGSGGDRISDNTVRIWDISTGNSTLIPIEFSKRISSVDFSSDNTLVAFGAWDGQIGIWDIPTKAIKLYRIITNTNGTKPRVLHVALSPKISVLLATSDNFEAYLYNTDDPRPLDTAKKALTTITGHTNAVTDGSFSPNGTYFATASADWTLQIRRTLDPDTDRFFLRGHTDSINSVQWSSDGKYILTSSNDNTARLWDFDARKEVLVLRGHTGSVTNASFSPNGKYIITASSDGTARIWAVEQDLLNTSQNVDELLSLAQSRVTRDLTYEEKQLYLNLTQK